MRSLFSNNSQYSVMKYKTHDEWLENRQIGIGGSDAATLVGMNPWKTNLQLWKEKVGIIKPQEITSGAIEHGNKLEPILRDWYKASHPECKVYYKPNTILKQNDTPWRLYSPDGLIVRGEQKGILEIKTTYIQNKAMLEKWKDGVPDNYYIQTLHGLLVTGFDFVHFVAELRFAWKDGVEIIEREFSREEVQDDLVWLSDKETDAYQYYIDKKEPPQILNL